MGNNSLSNKFFNLIQVLWRPVYRLMDAIVPNDPTTCRIIEALGLAVIAAVIGGPVTTAQPAMATGNVQDAFKHNRARQNVIVAGGLIMVCITLLSCVSSFMIYRDGFGDAPWFAQQALSLFAVIVVEGAFIALMYGFTRAFSSFTERITSLAGIVFLILVMLTNIITHFMMVKKLPLSPFQDAWLSWGAVSVFIIVLVIWVVIALSDPVSKLMRQELRLQGKQQEMILSAREEGSSSQVAQTALLERAEWEGQQLANQIIGNARQVGYGRSDGVRVSNPLPQSNFTRRPRRMPGKSRDERS